MTIPRWTPACLLIAALVATAASAFSDESLKDLSRLPHLQRHWLQRLEQQERAAKVTTLAPPPHSVAMTTIDAGSSAAMAADFAQEQVGEDERVTSSTEQSDAAASIPWADAAAAEEISSAANHRLEAGEGRASGTSTTSSITLSISQVKERLKARRIKSRKRIATGTDELYAYNGRKAEEPSHSASKEDSYEVKKHIQKMANSTCSVPAPRLVYVRQHFGVHHPNVRYLPTCTWLHRCSDDVGCCPDESTTCSPSLIELITLPFFVLTVVGSETKRTVARLTFENHTACECMGRNSDLMPRTEPFSDRRPELVGQPSGDQQHHQLRGDREKSPTGSISSSGVATKQRNDRVTKAAQLPSASHSGGKQRAFKCRCSSRPATTECLCRCLLSGNGGRRPLMHHGHRRQRHHLQRLCARRSGTRLPVGFHSRT